MEILKKIIFIFLNFTLITSCGNDSVTETIKVRSDTFISSSDQTNHSDLTYLNLSKSASQEERIILRLPTSEGDDNQLEDCFTIGSTCSIFFMPAAILVTILTACNNIDLIPANLTSAILVLNTNDNSSIAPGSLSLNLLSKPWWQTTNWTKAHPFSDKGRWDSPGGDKDLSTTLDSNCTNLSSGSCAATEVKFELTNYFRSLISNTNSIHYGLIITPNTNLSATTLYSVQENSHLSPRLVATYTGSCKNLKTSKERVFYLGSPIN